MRIRAKVSTDALAAAALIAEGKTQIQIADALGLSQSAVSRLLKDVKDYICVKRTFDWARLDPATEQEVRRRISHHEIDARVTRLAKEHGQPAPTVLVMPLGDAKDSGPLFDTFATHAAVALRDLLEGVRGRVGVAWGSTLWHTTQALRLILPQRPFRESAPIEFVPLCGDPLIDSQERYADRTSSRIVTELSKAVNGDEPRPAWLGLVPAFIPKDFRPSEIRVIDKLIDLAPQYRRIFGPRVGRPGAPPFAEDLSMIITAAGPARRPLGFGRNPLLGLNSDDTKTLEKSIYGDIGGVLLPRLISTPAAKGQEPAPRNLVQELTERWTGLKIEHLKACSTRAFAERSKSRPGVILLGFGIDHCEIMLEAVRRGLVNQLIIGSDLAVAMAAALPPAPESETPDKHAAAK